MACDAPPKDEETDHLPGFLLALTDVAFESVAGSRRAHIPDLRRRGGDRRARLAFHGCVAASIGVNMVAFIVVRLFLPDIGAALVGIALSTGVKFMSLDRLAFKEAGAARSDLAA